jgi:hypothetical protein
MYLISQKVLSPLRCYVAICHPGQVRLRRTRAGIQKEGDQIDLSLDSGSRPAKRSSSGMTGSANCVPPSPHRIVESVQTDVLFIDQ